MGPIAFDFIFVFSFCPVGRLRVARAVQGSEEANRRTPPC
jgi:hypothetical protein